MPFASFVFNENETARDRLEKCRTDHAFNLWQFSRDVGTPEYKLAVGRVQDALRMLDFTVDDPDGVYGDSTRKAVFAFKNTRSPKILGPGQTVPDSIVGKQTIAQLDAHLIGRSGRLPLPKPQPGDGKFQDVFVRVFGIDPRDARAGKPTTEGVAFLSIPDAATLRAKIDTPAYLADHREVALLTFQGGGGRANPASDPTSLAVGSVIAARSAAQAAGGELGKVAVIGFSIGGRAAATIARALVAKDVKPDFVGLSDAAFDDENDAARTEAIAASGENHFQHSTNMLRSKLPGLEFHGPVPGLVTVDLAAKDQSYDTQAELALAQGRAAVAASALHERAVRDSYLKLEARVVAMLQPAAPGD